MEKVSGQELGKLKSAAQKLDAIVTLGKAGISEPFLKSLNEALDQHELVKVRLAEFKEQKKEMAAALSEKTQSQVIQRVGHVVVLYRKSSQPKPPKNE